MKANPKLSKLILSLSAMLFFSLALVAQTPEVVLQSFAKKYPGAKSVKWLKSEVDTEHDVEFKWNKNTMTAQFDSDGNWLESETEMDAADLPGAVKLAISVTYSDYELDPDAVLLSTTERDAAYEVLVEKGGEVYKITFTAGGKELEKQLEVE